MIEAQERHEKSPKKVTSTHARCGSSGGLLIYLHLHSTYLFIVQYDTDGSGMIEFPEFCNMMSDKMNTVNDADMIRMAFRVLDKYGTGTISSKNFKHLMTHIGN